MIEAAAARDPGHRGIQHMIQPQTLRSAACGLSHANNILLTTGSYKGLKLEGPFSGRSRERERYIQKWTVLSQSGRSVEPRSVGHGSK